MHEPESVSGLHKLIDLENNEDLKPLSALAYKVALKLSSKANSQFYFLMASNRKIATVTIEPRSAF